LFAAALLFAGKTALAQSFTVQHDTVAFSTAGYYTALNGITNTGTSPVRIQWKVVSTNFPADWQEQTGICDITSCFTGAAIFGGSTHACNYNPGTGDFHMQIDQTSTTTSGSYYVSLKLSNSADASDSIITTFVVSKIPAGVATVKPSADISLYPNPAINELNLVFDAGADVKNILVYNIIGKLMTVYKVAGNSANLNIENLAAGVYFTRLQNSRGEITATRKFTKQ